MRLFKDLFSKAPQGFLRSFSYNPGYGDMNGACHHDQLKKTKDGSWIYISSNRKELGEPMLVSTYSVSEDAVKEFEMFIKENDIVSLSKRPDSNDFVTDYSPWNYGIDFDCSASGGSSLESYNISQYKKYSKKDFALMKELQERFTKLKGGLISETAE